MDRKSFVTLAPGYSWQSRRSCTSLRTAWPETECHRPRASCQPPREGRTIGTSGHQWLSTLRNRGFRCPGDYFLSNILLSTVKPITEICTMASLTDASYIKDLWCCCDYFSNSIWPTTVKPISQGFFVLWSHCKTLCISRICNAAVTNFQTKFSQVL